MFELTWSSVAVTSCLSVLSYVVGCSGCWFELTWSYIAVLPAARRGETKFHDPSRAIYLNSVSRRSGSHKTGGFLLGGIGNTAGNRLANGYMQDRASGSWRYSTGQPHQPEFSVNEMEKLKQPLATEQQRVMLNLMFVRVTYCHKLFIQDTQTWLPWCHVFLDLWVTQVIPQQYHHTLSVVWRSDQHAFYHLQHWRRRSSLNKRILAAKNVQQQL